MNELNPRPIFNDQIAKPNLGRINGLLNEVLIERGYQHQKFHGTQLHDPVAWLAILGEEVGEVNRAVVENDRANYRHELIQVAATAIAAVEALDLTGA